MLYYLDAYWDAPLLSAIYGSMQYDGELPEMIMGGLAYGGDNPNPGELRACDFTPTTIGDSGCTGEADKFHRFIDEQVIPYMEKNYPVDPKVRALSGSSLGGLFTLYALYKSPQRLALSPAVGWGTPFMFELDKAKSKENKTLAAKVFYS